MDTYSQTGSRAILSILKSGLFEMAFLMKVAFIFNSTFLLIISYTVISHSCCKIKAFLLSFVNFICLIFPSIHNSE